ncbi:uncharacterized protein LOC132278368 [Cornus florida]|uniref:uncharacterized protein LOC132278368 n=1 Tax=Cornus florida TaxID=4283 RepID=UPI0028993E3B|nr:uncharacterized protein LOC132278368 [Cornus florida]
MLVENEADLLDMLYLNSERININVYVEIKEVEPLNISTDMDDPYEDMDYGVDAENSEGEEEDSDEEVGDENNEEEDSDVEKDDVYDFRKENQDWMAEGDTDYVETNSDSSDDKYVGFQDNDEDYNDEDYNVDCEGGPSDYELNDEAHSDSSVEIGVEYPKRNRSKSKDWDKNIKGKEYVKVKGQPIKLEQYLLFENVKHFREVLTYYTIQEGFQIRKIKNESSRVTCVCKAKGCPWRIHASPLPCKTYMIKTYNDNHSCVRGDKNPLANSIWIAKKFFKKLKQNPQMAVESLRTALHEKYGIRAKKQQCYRAKKKALDVFKGNHGKSYSLLPSYRNEIMRTNPGSLVTLDYYDAEFNGVNRFRRIFIAFDVLRSGFIKGCRPFIGLDGCFLKGRHDRVLLSAVALDDNNGLFPIAYAVVESERKET